MVWRTRPRRIAKGTALQSAARQRVRRENLRRWTVEWPECPPAYGRRRAAVACSVSEEPAGRRTRRPAAGIQSGENRIVNNIIYIVGLVVIIAAVLGYFGLR